MIRCVNFPSHDDFKKSKFVDQELDDADGSKKFSREPGRVSNKL